MMGNYHVRFLGGKGVVTPLTYPVREEEMKIKEQKEQLGYKRLAFLITFGSFVLTYILLIINEKRVSDYEAFLEFPIQSALIALVTFIFVRGAYWVIDGFKKDKESSEKD